MKLYKDTITLHCDDCLQDNAVVRTKGPHLGAYCKSCGKWLKWLSKAEKDLITIYEFADSKLPKIVDSYGIKRRIEHTTIDEPNIIHVSSLDESDITDKEVPW